MKLTLRYPQDSSSPTTQISVSIPGDRPPLDEVLQDLVFPALLAAGYPEPELRSRLGMEVEIPTGPRGPEHDLGEPADPRFGFRARDGEWVPVPEGFELIGYSIVDPQDRTLDANDVRYINAGRGSDGWDSTEWVNGFDVYYAARIGSEAHRYLKGLVESTDVQQAESRETGGRWPGCDPETPADPRFGFDARGFYDSKGRWVEAPEGFEIVGFDVRDPRGFDVKDLKTREWRGDLRYWAAYDREWVDCGWADGGTVWYAARSGSEALRVLRGNL